MLSDKDTLEYRSTLLLLCLIANVYMCVCVLVSVSDSEQLLTCFYTGKDPIILLVNYNCITININGHDYCVEKRWGSSLYCILYVTLFINKADYTFRKLLLRTNSNSIDD